MMNKRWSLKRWFADELPSLIQQLYAYDFDTINSSLNRQRWIYNEYAMTWQQWFSDDLTAMIQQWFQQYPIMSDLAAMISQWRHNDLAVMILQWQKQHWFSDDFMNANHCHHSHHRSSPNHLQIIDDLWWHVCWAVWMYKSVYIYSLTVNILQLY